MKKKVLVVTHDAGGSEIIAAYVKKHLLEKDFHVYAAGPGARVFRREDIPFKKVPIAKKGLSRLVQKNKDVEFVLLGTGWMTTIERDALVEAKKNNLKTVVYLESWSGYRERFGYPEKSWQKNLPNEMWVGDKHASVIAKNCFPQTKIKLVPNQYFHSFVKRYRDARASHMKDRGILFLSDVAPGLEQIFETLLAILVKKKNSLSLYIRFHPADDRTRYDAIIKKYLKQIQVKKSTENDIVRDLLRARVVIGTETVAMAVASLSGIKTISITPPGKKSQLPFSEIIHVRRVRDIANLI